MYISTTRQRQDHRLNRYGSTKTAGVSLPDATLNSETQIWHDAIVAAGGTFGTNSIAWADALIVALQAETYDSKILWLLPLLGADLVAARMPLRDTFGVGIATNHGFVGTDFDEATGLQNIGGDKYFDTLFAPSLIGGTSAHVGGLGFWDVGTPTGGGPIGRYAVATNSNRFLLDIRSSSSRFHWGLFTNQVNVSRSITNGHYYGNASAANHRELWLNGSSLGSNTSADGVGNIADSIQLMSQPAEDSYNGICGAAYITDGSMSSGDIGAMHTLLGTYLITPTGR